MQNLVWDGGGRRLLDGWVGFALLILSGGMCLGTRIKPVEGKNKNIFKQLQLLPGCHAQAMTTLGTWFW